MINRIFMVLAGFGMANMYPAQQQYASFEPLVRAIDDFATAKVDSSDILQPATFHVFKALRCAVFDIREGKVPTVQQAVTLAQAARLTSLVGMMGKRWNFYYDEHHQCHFKTMGLGTHQVLCLLSNYEAWTTTCDRMSFIKSQKDIIERDAKKLEHALARATPAERAKLEQGKKAFEAYKREARKNDNLDVLYLDRESLAWRINTTAVIDASDCVQGAITDLEKCLKFPMDQARYWTTVFPVQGQTNQNDTALYDAIVQAQDQLTPDKSIPLSDVPSDSNLVSGVFAPKLCMLM